VTIGGVAAGNVVVLNATTINATTGPHAAGVVSVVVTNPDAQAATLNNAFTYAVTSSLDDRVFLGLGPTSVTAGWMASRKGSGATFNPGTWMQLPWPAYNATGGGLHVASGDVDGDGLDEIVVGLGSGGGGWIVVFDDAAHGYALIQWLQVAWPEYNTKNGEVWPAVGDVDNDGRAEIVAGLGTGGAGFIEVFDDQASGFAHLAWRQVAWPTYLASGSGAVHPAVANLDGVGASEII